MLRRRKVNEDWRWEVRETDSHLVQLITKVEQLLAEALLVQLGVARALGQFALSFQLRRAKGENVL